MKKFRFKIIWLTLTIIVMGITYYKFENKSAREVFDIKCPDMMSALQGDC